MEVGITPTSTSQQTCEWRSINWNKAHRVVRNLQGRIVKATQAGEKRKVRALQNILTRSISAKQLAVKRVTENHGKKTAGVDGEIWPTPEAKTKAVLSLTRRGYKPLPLRRVHIPKNNGKLRPLGIPTMKDRAMQALHLMALEPVSECLADRHSYGFRPERCTADAIGQIFNVLSRKTSAEWILEGDIKGCFDNISHLWMMEHIPMDKGVLQKWLSCGYVERNVFNDTMQGTPQGGIISPTLANLVLDGLEAALAAVFDISGPQSRKNKVHLIRYADDFVITGSSKELVENKVKPLVAEFLKTKGLELSEEKTRVTHIGDGFDFLGQNVKKYRGKLLIKPAKKNVKVFLKKVKDLIRENRNAKQRNLICILNPVIRGWGNYHQHVVSRYTFDAVDHRIWNMLWQWAKRRHPNKKKTWISDKYFHDIGTVRRLFSVKTQTEHGETYLRLFNLDKIPIRRHIKIKTEANPFDEEWEPYFEERLLYKMETNLKGYKKLLRLWERQKGICPRCNQIIDLETNWNTHHLIPRCRGGKDGQSNLILMHPHCHKQLHYQEKSVVEPRPVTGA